MNPAITLIPDDARPYDLCACCGELRWLKYTDGAKSYCSECGPNLIASGTLLEMTIQAMEPAAEITTKP